MDLASPRYTVCETRPYHELLVSPQMLCFHDNCNKTRPVPTCFRCREHSGRNDVYIYNLTHVSVDADGDSIMSAPQPCARLLDHRSSSPSCGRVTELLFLSSPPTSSSKGSTSTRLVAGTSAGYIHLWRQSSPQTKQRSQAYTTPNLVQRWKRISTVSVFQNSHAATATGHNFASSEAVSAISLLNGSSGIVAVGGSGGTVVLMNMNQLQRSSFSSEMTPTILNRVNVASSIREQLGSFETTGLTPPLKWLGVQELFISNHQAVTRRTTSDGDGHLCNQLSTVAISVVTRSGWVARLTFLPKTHPRTGANSSHGAFVHVIHTAPRATKVNTSSLSSSGQASSSSNTTAPAPLPAATARLPLLSTFDKPPPPPMICLPDAPIPGATLCSMHLAVIGMPPPVLIIQKDGRFDKYVAEDFTTLVKSNPGVVLMDPLCKVNNGRRPHHNESEEFNTQQIMIPLASAPTLIAVHPNDEWIAVACKDSAHFSLLSIRRRF
jgi:hypothetical protein